MSLARKDRLKLIGPAVIDFEFHLYPAILPRIPFDVYSSLLYVDRVGAPENKQFGWDLQRKAALLKAVVDTCGLGGEKPLWVTEMNWPLKGTGKYSPASGKPNVSEEDQADYLVRYYVLCLASGFIRRIYWWQLAAPGYGLIDSRGECWRKRPSYHALQFMTEHLSGSLFLRRVPCSGAFLFLFIQQGQPLLVCWTQCASKRIRLSAAAGDVTTLSGQHVSSRDDYILIDPSPKYVFFREGTSPEEIEAFPEDRFSG